jgi:hypothetical protein
MAVIRKRGHYIMAKEVDEDKEVIGALSEVGDEASNSENYTEQEVYDRQGELGITQDGIWGPKTQSAHASAVGGEGGGLDVSNPYGQAVNNRVVNDEAQEFIDRYEKGHEDPNLDFTDEDPKTEYKVKGSHMAPGKAQNATAQNARFKKPGGKSNSEKVSRNLKNEIQRNKRRSTNMSNYIGSRDSRPDYVSLDRPRGALTK